MRRPPAPAGGEHPRAARPAPLLGHSWDTKIFMATGYLVGTGHTPYLARGDLSAVFHHAGFSVISAIGYPPPWPLVLGVLYRGVYAVAPNLIVYNVAIKLPLDLRHHRPRRICGCASHQRGRGPRGGTPGLGLSALQPLPAVRRRRLGPDRHHRRAARRGGARGAARASCRRLGRSAGPGGLFQTDRRAHRPRRPRLSAGSLAPPGGAVRGRVRRCRADLLCGPLFCPGLEPGAVSATPQRPFRDEWHDVAHHGRKGVSRPLADDGQVVASRSGLGSRPSLRPSSRCGVASAASTTSSQRARPWC